MERPPLALFGGIFDPVHYGHLAVAALAIESLSLKRIVFVPAGNPPHKKTTVRAGGRHRLAMLRKAVSGRPEFSICTREIRTGRPSYSIDTVTWFQERRPGRPVLFIIGSDNLAEIETWKRWRDLIGRVTLCVAHRPGHAVRIPPRLRSAAIRTFPSPEWGISSTMIRSYVRQGYSCDFLLPPDVRQYIAAHRLYTTPPEPGDARAA